MKHKFQVLYELDCTFGEAVAAYLDAEHYAHLHGKHIYHHEALEQNGNVIVIYQKWKMLGLPFGLICSTEYQPPGRLLQYHFIPKPFWRPSIYHLIKVHTDLLYTPDATGTRTVSDLTVELDLPFFLWPLRHVIEDRLRRLKIVKDQEDIDMIACRQRLFGRGNVTAYLAKHQFLLHKEAFAKYFGL